MYAISAMGAGETSSTRRGSRWRISPKTSVCPLCRVMRTQLKKRGVAHHTVVYSTEEPLKIVADEQNGRHAPGSVSFVPPVVGLIMAGEIIKTIARATLRGAVAREEVSCRLSGISSKRRGGVCPRADGGRIPRESARADAHRYDEPAPKAERRRGLAADDGGLRRHPRADAPARALRRARTGRRRAGRR